MTLFNDVFSQDAFGFVSLSLAVNKLPYIESRLGDMNLFNYVEAVETDTVAIDETQGLLQILDNLPRGSEPQRGLKEQKAKSRAIKVPHLQFEDRVMASSLIGKRLPGYNVLQTVAAKVNERFQWMLNNSLAPTLEIHRLNALRGKLYDSDGTTLIYDYFDFFGVSQVTVNFTFSSPTFDVRGRAVQAIRQIVDTLGGVPFTGVRAICGRAFFDALTNHPHVRDTYLFQEGMVLREDLRKVGFNFGGIQWEEYRGIRGLPNNLGQIDDNEAIIFPEGVTSMYRTYYAPADFLESAGQLGQPMYARIAPDWKYNRWVDQLIEVNPLFINMRPQAVFKVTKS